jgi:CRISPR-associated protein Cmr4
MEITRVYWLHTLSPTHVGTGQGVGFIDLPIHRDKVTNWPVIPGSAFKGVLANHFGAGAGEDKRPPNSIFRAAFGFGGDDSANAGALIPTDARLVCLPVRSFQGTFAWCTSPLVLQMLQRDLSFAHLSVPDKIPAVSDTDIHRTTTTKLEESGRIFLEDLDFAGKECAIATQWAKEIAGWVFPRSEDEQWRERFAERFAVLSNDIFDFLAEHGTEVSTRVHIDDNSKTVKDGQLWNEEALPAETILAGLICCDGLSVRQGEKFSAADLIGKFADKPLLLQVGGKATVGRGRVCVVFTGASEVR